MRNRYPFVLSTAAAGMELCWLYSWAVFSLSPMVDRPIPLLGALAVFAAGLGLTRVTLGKGWRIVVVLGLHLAGFVCVTSILIRSVYFPHYSFNPLGWWAAVASELHGFVQWAGFGAMIFWALLLWLGGVGAARRPATYYRLCSRFDIGLAAFFCLFLFRLALRVKGGVILSDGTPELLVFPFFLFAVTAIQMARAEGDGEGARHARGGVGIVAGFVLAVLALVGLATASAISGLNAAARVTHGALSSAAHSSMPFVERILFLLFSRGNVRPEAPSPSRRGSSWALHHAAGQTWWMEWVDRILGYGLWGMGCLMATAIFTLALVFLARWLFSRTRSDRTLERPSYGIPEWLLKLWAGLKCLGKEIMGIARRNHSAAGAYGTLLQWALRTGCPLRRGETPLEFGTRLGYRFPVLSPEITTIVQYYNQEIYGGVQPVRERLRLLLAARRTLRNPLYWPLRLKARALRGRAGRLAA